VILRQSAYITINCTGIIFYGEESYFSQIASAILFWYFYYQASIRCTGIFCSAPGVLSKFEISSGFGTYDIEGRSVADCNCGQSGLD
jgi:hypothetical protein